MWDDRLPHLALASFRGGRNVDPQAGFLVDCRHRDDVGDGLKVMDGVQFGCGLNGAAIGYVVANGGKLERLLGGVEFQEKDRIRWTRRFSLEVGAGDQIKALADPAAW